MEAVTDKASDKKAARTTLNISMNTAMFYLTEVLLLLFVDLTPF